MGFPGENVQWCTVGHPRALDETSTRSRAIDPTVARVTSGESTASLLAVAGRLAGKDREPLRGLLVPMDPVCDLRHTARHGAGPVSHTS
jgi:hypothetical protein